MKNLVEIFCDVDDFWQDFSVQFRMVRINRKVWSRPLPNGAALIVTWVKKGNPAF